VQFHPEFTRESLAEAADLAGREAAIGEAPAGRALLRAFVERLA
jgi:GMP synthase-like glutamine amidotransferase